MEKPQSVKEYRMLSIATAPQKVMEVIFKYPDKEFSLSDLAKEAGVAKPNMSEILAQLQSKNLVQIEKLSKIWRIRANRTNQEYIRNKIIYNLNFIYQSGLIEFLVKAYGNPKAIVLFGSFRKGEDLSTSDIDIAIEDSFASEYNAVYLGALTEYEKSIGRRIQIHEFNRKTIEIHVFNNIANGIVLHGFLEVKK
ncbi:nucleotidyltransferase domain-containing protein [Candidatus Pacearchaeota archaeon]|nr:nucleotidyltransferase domain-containing protein [Candidatus Pacearchaeota archaeon]